MQFVLQGMVKVTEANGTSGPSTDLLFASLAKVDGGKTMLAWAKDEVGNEEARKALLTADPCLLTDEDKEADIAAVKKLRTRVTKRRQKVLEKMEKEVKEDSKEDAIFRNKFSALSDADKRAFEGCVLQLKHASKLYKDIAKIEDGQYLLRWATNGVNTDDVWMKVIEEGIPINDRKDVVKVRRNITKRRRLFLAELNGAETAPAAESEEEEDEVSAVAEDESEEEEDLFEAAPIVTVPVPKKYYLSSPVHYDSEGQPSVADVQAMKRFCRETDLLSGFQDDTIKSAIQRWITEYIEKDHQIVHTVWTRRPLTTEEQEVLISYVNRGHMMGWFKNGYGWFHMSPVNWEPTLEEDEGEESEGEDEESEDTRVGAPGWHEEGEEKGEPIQTVLPKLAARAGKYIIDRLSLKPPVRELNVSAETLKILKDLFSDDSLNSTFPFVTDETLQPCVSTNVTSYIITVEADGGVSAYDVVVGSFDDSVVIPSTIINVKRFDAEGNKWTKFEPPEGTIKRANIVVAARDGQLTRTIGMNMAFW